MIQMEHVHQPTRAQLSISECCAIRWNLGLDMHTKTGIKDEYQGVQGVQPLESCDQCWRNGQVLASAVP